jgi:hypothetical protein
LIQIRRSGIAIWRRGVESLRVRLLRALEWE